MHSDDWEARGARISITKDGKPYTGPVKFIYLSQNGLPEWRRAAQDDYAEDKPDRHGRTMEGEMLVSRLRAVDGKMLYDSTLTGKHVLLLPVGAVPQNQHIITFQELESYVGPLSKATPVPFKADYNAQMPPLPEEIRLRREMEQAQSFRR